MLRALFFVLIALSLPTAAQTPATRKSFAEGIQNAQGGNFENAAVKFRLAIMTAENENAPDDFLARVRFNLGVCLYRLKQADKSIAEFTEAIRLSRRTYQRAFYALGMAESELKNFERAETAFRDALRLDETDGEAWFDLGLLYLQKRDFASAEKAFFKAVRFRSANVSDAHNNLGVIFAVRGEFNAAEREFERALNIADNQSPEARSNLRFCKLLRQQNERAANLVAALKLIESRSN